VDAMDKITELKQLLTTRFAAIISKAQRGYTLENYSDIIQAMQFLDMIEDFDVDPYKTVAIVDLYLRKLINLQWQQL
jgi:hypothetical protein